MLPRLAPTPPCAATVCERVGNTLLSTATFSPARDRRSDACMPEPPAPTMTTSKRRLEIEPAMTLQPPENLHRPAGAADEPHDGEHLQRQPHARRLDVVHPDVANADPGVDRQRDDDHQGQQLHPLRGEDARPLVVAHLSRHQHLHQQHQREHRHQRRGGPLAEPAAAAVVRADDEPLRSEVVAHVPRLPGISSTQYSPNSLAPSATVSTRLATSATMAEERPCSLLMWCVTSIQRNRSPANRWCLTESIQEGKITINTYAPIIEAP